MLPVVFQYELVTIEHDEQNSMLCLAGEAYLTNEEFMYVMRMLVQYTQKLPITKWLINARNLDRAQGGSDWIAAAFPKLLQNAQLKKVAFCSSNPTRIADMQEIINKVTANPSAQIQIRIFSNSYEASKWLHT